jgi:hypothetical protein
MRTRIAGGRGLAGGGGESGVTFRIFTDSSTFHSALLDDLPAAFTSRYRLLKPQRFGSFCIGWCLMQVVGNQ